MGVVRRQGLKRTLVAFFGVLIGTISVLKIYPKAFDIYGMAQFILAAASLLIPFVSFGISRLTVHFFPDFKDEKTKHHGFLGLLILITAGSFFVFSTFMVLFGKQITAYIGALDMDENVFWENRVAILVISLLLVLNSIFAQFASNFKRIVIPEIFNNLFLKISLPVLVLLYFWKTISEQEFRLIYMLSFLVVTLGLVAYLIYLGEFSLRLDLNFLSKPLFKTMMLYGAFNALSTVGYLFSFRIDSIMVTSYLGYESNGYYSFFSYMVNIIVIPYMSMVAIASPIIAQSHRDGDLMAIGKLYRQSSETLFISGVYFIFGVWLCLDALLEITNKAAELESLKYTFLLLGMGQLVNVTTGLNEPIIGYSRYYRFNLYTMLVLAAMNVIMNLIMIPRYGIVGAALATAISFIIYNIVQCLFIYHKFGILPFSLTHLKIAILLLISVFLTSLVSFEVSAFLQILLKGGVFSILFIVPILYFRISTDISNMWYDFQKKGRMIMLLFR